MQFHPLLDQQLYVRTGMLVNLIDDTARDGVPRIAPLVCRQVGNLQFNCKVWTVSA
jgi:hypothetical protein